MSDLKNKYKRQPKEVPQKKGNADIISRLAGNTGTQEPVITEKRKATFEMDANLHKRLRMFAAQNDTTMLDVVQAAVIEYLDRAEK